MVVFGFCILEPEKEEKLQNPRSAEKIVLFLFLVVVLAKEVVFMSDYHQKAQTVQVEYFSKRL